MIVSRGVLGLEGRGYTPAGAGAKARERAWGTMEVIRTHAICALL